VKAKNYTSIVQYIYSSTNRDEEEVLVSSNLVGDFSKASPTSEPKEVADKNYVGGSNRRRRHAARGSHRCT
jgi:hypothetical protein